MCEGGRRRKEEEGGGRRRTEGRKEGRRDADGSAQPKTRTPHNDLGNDRFELEARVGAEVGWGRGGLKCRGSELERKKKEGELDEGKGITWKVHG